jgi:hypothetical protein
LNFNRYFRVGDNLELDGNFRLHYGLDQKKVLEPCKEILDPLINVAIVDNNYLNPRRLLLVNKDRAPISVYQGQSEETVSVDFPGKSAFLHLTNCLAGKALVEHTVLNHLEGDPNRRDHLHCTPIKDILNVGWHTFWAPLQNVGKVFHARLVADRTMYFNEDPTMEDANALADVFKKLC